MLVRLSAVLAAAVALASAGCWFFSPTSLDGLAEASLRAQCHFAFACCTAPERAEFTSQASFKDEGTCVSESLDTGSGSNNVVDRAKAVIAANHGTFDQKRADACVKPLIDAQTNCDSKADLGGKPIGDATCGADAARGFVVGNVKDGGKCNDDIECADFGTCDRSDADPNTVTTEGKCKASRKEGEECIDQANNQFFNCVPGTSCQADQAGKFTCQKDKLLDNGAQCNDGSECTSGFCTEGEVKECTFSGDACTADADCADAAFGETCDSVNTTTCTADGPKVDVCNGL